MSHTGEADRDRPGPGPGLDRGGTGPEPGPHRGFDPREIRDFWPRLLVSPILGALVVNLSGLIDNSRHSALGRLGSYAWFTVVAFLVWEGNRRLYFRLQHREDWLLRPWRRLGLLLTVIGVYTIPVATLLLWSWREVTGDPGTRPYALPTALFAVVALVVAIAHVYETVFLLRDWESDRLRRAHTEQARLQTELESLGREVDPHFLFNNLNALVHLIEKRSDAAPGFISALSGIYRYVLDCRGRTLVPLADELEALERHRALADIRYAGRVQLDIQVPPVKAERLWLPPVSLPELFQNALKHNTVKPGLPLDICVWLDDTTLIFENGLRSAALPQHSTGIGLTNLAERFRLSTGGTVEWGARDGRFVVRLPLARHGGSGPVP